MTPKQIDGSLLITRTEVGMVGGGDGWMGRVGGDGWVGEWVER